MISQQTTVGFIGAGNMATALVQGLLSKGLKPEHLTVADPDQEKLQHFHKLGISTSTDNQITVKQADIVVLAIKPQIMEQVLTELAPVWPQANVLLISIAAGITLESLQTWTYPEQAVIRCMPNTPALVQAGASALFANAFTREEQKQEAEVIMKAVGTVCWLDNEEQMDAVTALSGSGPAYFFLLMEAMTKAGEALGLDSELASQLSVQTAYGAAKLARQSDVDIAELRRRVTSPGGTTEAALRQFGNDNFSEIVQQAMNKAAQRSKELAGQAK